MPRLRAALLTSSALVVVLGPQAAGSALAQDATWLANPGSANYYDANNWSPAAVPTGTATFGSSATTALTLGTGGSIGGWTFSTGASAYTFDITAGTSFTGAGIVVNGGSASITNYSLMFFMNGSTAGTAAITTNDTLIFNDSSTAGTATITNRASVYFNGNSTAGNAQLINDPTSVGGASVFFDFSGASGPNGDYKISAGSIAGNGMFFLGANELTVGSNNLSTEVTGVIADGGAGGSLVKVGTGTLTLSGTNTYTGGTTFAGGTVSVSSDANLGGAAGSLTFNGGALQITGTAFTSTARTINLGAGGGTFDIVNAANIFAVTQGLTGTGGLTKAGAGMLTLQGANTYTGATTVSAGTLRIADSIASSTITVNGGTLLYSSNATAGTASITNNSQLTFDTNATAGSAVITNSGTVLFDGNSTAGSAQLINTAPGAVVNFFTPGPASDGKITAGSIAGNGRFDLNSIELTVGSNNLSTTVSGVLTGDGIVTGTSLIKTGTGTLTLAGINTYTGATIVDGGTLAVNGSIASSFLTTVNASGTLAGNGVVGNTTINGGTLAPGNSIGLLTVQGNLVLTAASRYMIEVSPVNADRVNVTGTANLGGATVNASFAQGSYLNKRYTIVNATGGLGGTTFSALVNSNLPSSVTTSLSYDTNNAYLDLKLDFVPPPDTGLGRNQSGVGNALVDYFNRNGGIPLVYSGLTQAGLTQASGETATGGQQTAFNAMTQFMGSMTDTFAAGRGNAPGAMGFADDSNARTQSARDAYAMFTKAPLAQSYDPRWSVWASGFGGSQTTDGNGTVGSNTSTSRIYGVAAGADYRLSPATIAGFAMVGGGTSFSVTGGGSGRSDLFQIGGFVRHAIGATYLSSALAYGWQDVTTDRTVIADRLQARFNANTFSGRFEAGHRVTTSWLGGLGLTPYAAAQVTAIALPAYAETVVSGSNAFALSYAGKTVTDTRSELGLRSDKSFALDGALLTLRGRAAWAHDFNTDRAASATFLALPGASFTVNGAAAAHDAALTTASAEVSFLNGISLAATFEGEFSQVTRSYAGKGVARYSW